MTNASTTEAPSEIEEKLMPQLAQPATPSPATHLTLQPITASDDGHATAIQARSAKSEQNTKQFGFQELFSAEADR
ncbi:MAG: hypothetical protein H6707_01735 [Deltaproteobacteria bacterium]|nr:hypothetical protein [Deltaproteobacteria bacterium]